MSAVAVLGLGTMGRGMATNLVSAGHAVTVWNRSEVSGVAGARSAGSIAEAVRGQDVVLYCLSDDAAVRDVALGAGGVLAHVAAPTVVVDMSTVSLSLSEEEHAAFAERDVDLLDAPVFGSRGEAASGGLWVVVGGDAGALDRARPALEAVSATVHHLGPATSGVRMKLVGNLLVAAQLQSLGEALTLARAAGLDLRTVLDVVSVADFRTPIYDGVGAAVLADDYSPAFALRLMHKDVGLIEDLAGRVGAPVPGVGVVAQTLEDAMAAGLGGQNASALIRVLAGRAGVSLAQP
ncbi:NAD(P)-dependent oxidoreductase [Georgenia wutianyii]|uniref:NAD(P)-dependent oxidoreductase n=1 Tax=Georgenia wutianyii TaxID=2585135 RepID=A0ABX5VJP0_9MICO|nr:NAD(P)-dependent oxidoreductase [Georgenia wutianyii]QDB78652.1 NAD(P)-dependent oxidoreductase [Georgenia wutianyii]